MQPANEWTGSSADTQGLQESERLAQARFGDFVGATIVVALAALACLFVQRLSHPNLSIVFLCAVLVVAVRWGRWPSIYASVISFLVFNFLFTPPLLTLRVTNDGDIETLIFFLAIASLAGHLAARARLQMQLHGLAVRRISSLLNLTNRISVASTPEHVVSALVGEVVRTYDVPTLGYLPSNAGPLQLCASAGMGNDERPPADDVLDKAWQGATVHDDWHFVPIATSGSRCGLIALRESHSDAARESLIRNMCAQAAVVLERALVRAQLEKASQVADAEQLRAALLSSMSHDLRPPLDAILESVGELVNADSRLDQDQRLRLAQRSLREAQRMGRYMRDLAEVTRSGREGGALIRQWASLGDLVKLAADKVHPALAKGVLKVDVKPEAGLVHVHEILFERALANMLEHIALQTSGDAGIVLHANSVHDKVVIDITGQGASVAAGNRDETAAVVNGAQSRDGAGNAPFDEIGLSIARALVAAHHGTVEFVDGPRGAQSCLRVTLPATPHSEISSPGV